MEKNKVKLDKWYKCLYCWNFSIEPAKCCGVNMTEIEEDKEVLRVHDKD